MNEETDVQRGYHLSKDTTAGKLWWGNSSIFHHILLIEALILKINQLFCLDIFHLFEKNNIIDEL